MIGQILKQRYKIINQLGSGGFGETYLAQDLDIPIDPKPLCVVKRLQPTTIDPIIERLFEHEAQILYKLGQNHEQIPKLFAYFEEQGQFYLIQEFIEGQDISQEIIIGKPWTEKESIDFLQEMLSILTYVHENKVIHRDIKPANIRRRKDGKLVLIDFGVVKEVSTLVVNARGLTSRTVAIGTLGYMPSEQAIGKPKLNSDLYALGMTTIEGLTGVFPDQLPEDNEGEVIWGDRVSVSDELVEFLSKMVRYDFRQRYGDAREALQELNRVFAGVNSSNWSFVPPTIISASVPDVRLEPKSFGEKWGYVDGKGKVVITPQFDYAFAFSEGLARVKINSKWGYIDKTGQCVIAPQFDHVLPFTEGLAGVEINSKYGYIDKTGQCVIAPQFDDALFFKQDLALVKINSNWGWIDKTGQFVIAPQFEDALFFEQDLALVKINSKLGWIDKTGRFVIAPQFDEADNFTEGLALVKINSKLGWIDKTGRFIIAPQFDGADYFSEKLAMVKINSKYGYINKTGQLVIAPQFDLAGSFSNGRAEVMLKQGNKEQWRIIDKTGKFMD